MSKKHFIELADMIRQSNGTSAEFSGEQLAVLASFCKRQNPAFDYFRWTDYIRGECGPSGGKVKARIAA